MNKPARYLGAGRESTPGPLTLSTVRIPLDPELERIRRRVARRAARDRRRLEELVAPEVLARLDAAELEAERRLLGITSDT